MAPSYEVVFDADKATAVIPAAETLKESDYKKLRAFAMEFTLHERDTIPHLDQYFGWWCMEEAQFRALAEHASGLDIRVHLASFDAQDGQKKRRETLGRIARIDLLGTLMKAESSFTRSTSTVEAKRAVRLANADKDIDGILLNIDSPGGTVAGTKELADEVARVEKPVFAFIEDLGASAAFWIASQADKVFANKTGLVGSIGTFGVVVDRSVQAAQQGIRVHVVRAGQFKGAGVPGTEVTAEQLAESQRIVDQLNEMFLEAVRDGRKMSMRSVRELADGRIHVAEDAQSLGLIDGVQSFDETFDKFAESLRRKRAMSQAASLTDLRRACVGADSEFLMDQLEREATVEQAVSDWMTEQQLRLEERDKQLAASRKELEDAKAADKSPGVDPVMETVVESSDSGDPIDEWKALVDRKIQAGMNRQRAISAANKENPRLRQEMIEAYNLQHSDRRRRA